MKIRVLGSSGSEGPGYNPTAFLIDDFLLLDAGTVSLSLDLAAQCRISHVFLSHAHLDHIKGIPFLVDNMASEDHACSLTILSGKEVIADLKKNIFNRRIWPDFTLIPSTENPVMRYRALSTRGCFEINGYKVYTTKVDHSVPAYGFLVEDSTGCALLYTGDTGPTERIWKRMRGHQVKVLIIEVSFPDSMMDLALTSGHLTPSLLERELLKMPYVPETILATHLKPFYRETIEEQLAKFMASTGIKVEVLRDDISISCRHPS